MEMEKQERKLEQEPEQKHLPWRDGLPTGPDVALLQKTFPTLTPGDRIAYEAVAEIIGIPVGEQRFATVTQAWRAREEEKGIVILCERGKAFLVATADQITAGTYATLEHVGRCAKKQRRHLGTIRHADDATRITVEHQARLMLEVERDAKAKRKNSIPSLQAPDVRPPLPGKVSMFKAFG
jgi:hypothetical protein